MEWITAISFAFLASISVAASAALGCGTDPQEKQRPGMFPLCALTLILLTELINYESEFIPLPDRSNLIIVLMRIGVMLSMLWGLRFILICHRKDAEAVAWAILASVVVGIYWIAIIAGAFPALA